MAGIRIGRFIGFAVLIYGLLMFVFFARSTTGLVQVGYPIPWLRMTDGSYEILANGFLVDTLIWLTASLIISLAVHMIKKK